MGNHVVVVVAEDSTDIYIHCYIYTTPSIYDAAAKITGRMAIHMPVTFLLVAQVLNGVLIAYKI